MPPGKATRWTGTGSPEGEEPLIRQAIEKVGGTLLKPIKESLPEEITYTAIKAVLAKMADSS